MCNFAQYEDERDTYGIPDENTYEQSQASASITGLGHGPIHGFAEVLEKDMSIRDRTAHRRLKEDLMEHIWQKFGFQPQQN